MRRKKHGFKLYKKLLQYKISHQGPYQKNRGGFSLLELLVSMIIMGVVIAGSVGLFTTANTYIRKEKTRTQASNQATKIMERLSYYVGDDGLGDDAFALGLHETDVELYQVGLGSIPVFDDNVDNEEWSFRVRNDVAGGSQCKRVDVVIRWED